MTYEPSPELADLLGALLDDEITVEESDRLAEILTVDDNARACYRELIETHAMMVWQRRSVGSLVDGLVDLEAAPVADLGRLPILSSLGGAFNSVANQMLQGWPLAYLLATVIFGIGLVIGSLTPVSSPVQIVKDPPPSTPSVVEPKTESVGRITGMVACEFEEGSRFGVQGSGAENQRSEIRNLKSLVALGEKFALSSGLMEITYDTGAKVILQGPVTYEVESAKGGYLSLGKLTARVESGEWRVDSKSPNLQVSKSPNSSLSTLHSPLFTIQTPTAVVTDLGTEFGVEVGKSGATAAHVFRGTVEVQPAADGDRPDSHVVRLVQNESVRIERRQGGNGANVYRGKADAVAFVRPEQLRKLVDEQRLKPLRRWQTYSQQLRKDLTLVAYYSFESAGKDSWLLPNVATTGPALDGEIQGPLWTSGRLPGKVALHFRGPGTGAKVVLPEPQRFNFAGPFSLAIWFQVAQFSRDCVPSLIAKGGATWRLQRYGTNNSDFLTVDSNGGDDKYYTLRPHTEVTDGRWHLAVAVIEPREKSHRKRLYLDGRMEVESDNPAPLGRNDEPVWIGASSISPSREFEGRIDEVMIFARALPVKEIATMFQAGTPTQPSANGTSN